LIELLCRRGDIVTADVRIARSRDPDDDEFLECVGADAKSFTLREVQGVPIVDVPTFWQALVTSPLA
jgi:hypothetical protein